MIGDIHISVELHIEDVTTEEDRHFASVQIMSLQTSNLVEESSAGVTLQ